MQIYTNLGRSYTIFRKPDRFGDHGFLTDRMDKFVAPAGTAITGFFGARVSFLYEMAELVTDCVPKLASLVRVRQAGGPH